MPPHVSAGLTLRPYDIRVSNFNDNENLQGTGSTIMRIGADGQPSLFYQSPAYGMSAALGVVQRAFVFAGNLQTYDGSAATVQPGSLQILDGNGKLVGQIVNTSFINGLWGMAIMDRGTGRTFSFPTS